MTREEAIKWMEETIQDAGELLDKCSPALKEEVLEQNEVFKISISALRSAPQPGNPLTLEQLREMDGQPVWCEDVGKWALVSVDNVGEWKGVPFALFMENGAKFNWNVEVRKLTLYSYPPAQQRWIPVSERLPEDEDDGETVLAVVFGKPHKNITLHHAIMTAEYFYQGGWLVNEYPEWENPTVTHWMPLPEPPEEG